ncbi:UV DNA damage repair endonuclease UvsE [Bacillus solitudinis]|uniref:UV DNA damage repair endonuclease UvsE n=1 Tax=Bacillus solitudinis TaxID=2014074 RepID=UPI000C23E8A9|nr:UV DNA damage repair endonuclease UvsE [Bacillus solitudinis]
MYVRFGYVAMSEQLVNASPSQTMTVKQFEKISNKEAAIHKLERIAKSNLNNCLRLLMHNLAYDIQFFRFSSRIVPLVNHPLTEGWKYEHSIKEELKKLGKFINVHDMRVDFHPDHFVVLNSPSKEILSQSVQTLIYHYKLLKGMGLNTKHRCVLHVGGKKQGKEEGLEQFIKNFGTIPRSLQEMIMLENDDVNYTAEEVLYLGEKLAIPVVFDLHHFDVNQETSTILLELWKRVINTWKDSPFPVKIHISSPKEGRFDRSHHDYIEVERFYNFLSLIKGSVRNLDVMIEAKKKDEALLKLVNELSKMEDFKLFTQASMKMYSNG